MPTGKTIWRQTTPLISFQSGHPGSQECDRPGVEGSERPFDLKNTNSSIKLEGEDTLQLASSDEYKLTAVTEILQQKLIKRGISLNSLTYEKIEPATGNSVRQKIKLTQGIASEKAKEIVRVIKDSKKKVQASIQGDTVRITGKDRDTLQEAIALLKGPRFKYRHAVHQLPYQLALRSER